MTTSGTIDFNQNASAIVRDAWLTCRAIDASESLSATMAADGLRWLNMIVKTLPKGMGLWLRQEVTIFLVASQQSYSLSASGANWAATSDAVQTETTAASASGASTIAVSSIMGIANADKIGVELNDGTVQWTTVNGVPAGLVVTLAAALTDDVAIGKQVFAYTTKLPRPVDIVEMRLRDKDGIETPLEILSRQDYMKISNKATSGKISSVYFDPQQTTPKLFVWPATQLATDRIVGTVKRVAEDLDILTNDIDFPQEWYLALVKLLAANLAPQAALPLAEREDLRNEAEAALATASAFDTEGGSVTFYPASR